MRLATKYVSVCKSVRLPENHVGGVMYYSDPQNIVVLPFFLSIKGGANFEPPTSVHKKRVLTR